MAKVLVVEDEVPIRNLLRMNLRTRGYEVIEAYTGREAMARALFDRPDAVIMDEKIPVTGGVATLQALKKNKHTRRIPVLLLSTFSEEEMGMKAQLADVYVELPFNMQQLMETLDQMMSQER